MDRNIAAFLVRAKKATFARAGARLAPSTEFERLAVRRRGFEVNRHVFGRRQFRGAGSAMEIRRSIPVDELYRQILVG